jgi:hypothetical protein
MLTLRVKPNPPLRILDFDCEARPLSWIGGDYVSKEITAIACAWVDEPDRVHCWCLGEGWPMRDMLDFFLVQYERADIVTGHYIRGFDLPLMNSALSEVGLPPLADKLTHDTKLDLVRRHGMSSSQKNLAAMLGCSHPKVEMTDQDWREANRLTPAGIAKTRARVTGDVRQHIEMREKLLARAMLLPPRMWRSASGARLPEYTP